MIAVLLLLAAPESGVARLLEKEADVSVDKPGLSRLMLPAEVLSASRPDLGDVRLYDGAVEIPYVVDGGEGHVSQQLAGPLKTSNVKRERRDRHAGPPIYSEAYELELEGPAMLVIETALTRFVRKVTIDGEEHTIFRINGAAKNEVRIGAERKRTTVHIEGEDDGYLEPRFFLRSEKVFGSTPRDLDVAYDKVHFAARDKKTVLTVERTRGLVPTALVLAATTDIFDRQVRVYDGDRYIGGGRIFRVGGFVPIESLLLRVGGAIGTVLRVEIEDKDSPPLAGVTLRGIVRQPSLVFSAPSTQVTLRFGGGRATRPRYDVADLGYQNDTAAFERLFRPNDVKPARLSGTRPNPQFDSKPALAFAMRPGAVVDVRKFTHRRAVTIEASREGLSLLTLSPEDQAHARSDLGDVRVVDKKGRQWPYLLDPRARTQWSPLTVNAPVTADKRSRHRLTHDFGAVHMNGLELEIEQSFADRDYELFALDGDAEALLVSGRLNKPADSEAPITLTFSTDRRATGFLLEVNDGDDAPLAIKEARARFDVEHVYVAAEPGPYFVLFGAPNEARPTYEIERARETVLAVRANETELGTLENNPDYTVASKLDDKSTALEIGLWVAIGLAVLVLGGLTLRLSRDPST
jgi:hypothetical protein